MKIINDPYHRETVQTSDPSSVSQKSVEKPSAETLAQINADPRFSNLFVTYISSGALTDADSLGVENIKDVSARYLSGQTSATRSTDAMAMQKILKGFRARLEEIDNIKSGLLSDPLFEDFFTKFVKKHTDLLQPKQFKDALDTHIEILGCASAGALLSFKEKFYAYKKACVHQEQNRAKRKSFENKFGPAESKILTLTEECRDEAGTLDDALFRKKIEKLSARGYEAGNFGFNFFAMLVRRMGFSYKKFIKERADNLLLGDPTEACKRLGEDGAQALDLILSGSDAGEPGKVFQEALDKLILEGVIPERVTYSADIKKRALTGIPDVGKIKQEWEQEKSNTQEWNTLSVNNKELKKKNFITNKVGTGTGWLERTVRTFLKSFYGSKLM